jgi:hypothetical protein
MPEGKLNICNISQHLFTYSNGITQRPSCGPRVVPQGCQFNRYRSVQHYFSFGLITAKISQFLLQILTLTLIKSFTLLVCFLFVIIQMYRLLLLKIRDTLAESISELASTEFVRLCNGSKETESLRHNVTCNSVILLVNGLSFSLL